jgi:hypothetical protein
VSADGLVGYHEFLRQRRTLNLLSGPRTSIISERTAYQLTDMKKHELAMEEYSKAIDLVPQFLEAIDNRAFCKMDLGRWPLMILKHL